MWTYLDSSTIDRTKWDACVSESKNEIIYGYTWYLDVVAPNWAGLVYADYQAVFALPIRKKMGLKYVFQPNFIQRIESFGPEDRRPTGQDFRILPKDIILVDMTSVFSIDPESQAKNNVILSLDNTVDDLFAGFSKNTKRNFKKAEGLNLRWELEDEAKTVPDLIKMFKDSKPYLLAQLPDHFFQDLKNLAEALSNHKQLSVVSVYRGDERWAGAVVARTGKRHTLLFTAADEEARKNGAMHYLLGKYLMKYAGKDLVFDFEGSSNSGVARFYLSFGGQTETYFHTRRKRIFNRSL